MARPESMRLDDQLCFALYAASNGIVSTYRPLLARIGLTYPQYLVMLVLWEDGRCTVGELATRLRLTAHALTPMLRRLEKSGFVVRARDETDQRVVRIRLTRAGSRLQTAAAEVQQEVAAHTLRCAPGYEALREDLQDFVAAMTDVETPDRAPVD